jgi:hypothetical protein
MVLHALGNWYPVLTGLISKSEYTYYLVPFIILVVYSIYKLWKHSKEPKT